MRKTKMTKFVAPAVFCAATVMPIAGMAGSAFATGHDYIRFSTRQDGGDAVVCSFYDSVSPSDYDACDESYGSYDTTSNELTLGVGINDLPNGYVNVNMDQLTISASGDIESGIYAMFAEVTLDFGDHSFTDTPFKIAGSGDSTVSKLGSNLTIESGTINVDNIDLGLDGSLSIKGGVINTDPGSVIAVRGNYINISGGLINIPGCHMAVYGGRSASFNMTGGEINAQNIETSGISDFDNFNISGGKITLESADTPAGFGIYLKEGKDLIIGGGNIMIDGFDWGISGNNSKIYFNDGTTVIKNSQHHTIWIKPAKDPENDIVFGEGMGIKENTYVFYGDDYEGTGIAESGTVTIAKGYTYRKHYGWETIDNDSEADIKVPDTGMFGGENGNSMIAMISVGLIALVSGIAYISGYIVKRYRGRVGFKK